MAPDSSAESLLSDKHLEDRELVDKFLRGDTDAEELFYSLFRPRLYRTSVYFLGSQDPDAEDVVQETFLIALPKIKDFDFCAPLYAWLRQICVYLCYERLRKRKRVLLSLEEDLETFTRKLAADRVRDRDEEEDKRVKLALLEKLKKEMDEPSRKILELRDSQGQSYAEISRNLNIPIGTVMSRLARSREALRKLVHAQAQERKKEQAARPGKGRQQEPEQEEPPADLGPVPEPEP
jgi:RNA polymerase sigma-70 factor (ECF subfamily)